MGDLLISYAGDSKKNAEISWEKEIVSKIFFYLLTAHPGARLLFYNYRKKERKQDVQIYVTSLCKKQ